MKVDKEKLREAIPTHQYYRDQLGEPKSGKYFCPFHEDKNTPNMVADENGVKCFACGESGDIFWFHGKLMGLSFTGVLKELADQYAPNFLSNNENGHQNLSKKEVAQYDYRDGDGKLLFQVVRYQQKEFRQRHPDGNGDWIWDLKGVRRVPYRLPELIASTGPVYIPGGEKDCETLIKHGLTATTNAGATISGSDSEGLVFIVANDSGMEIWRARLADKALQQMTATPDQEERRPVWSGQAKLVAFVARNTVGVMKSMPAMDLADVCEG